MLETALFSVVAFTCVIFQIKVIKVLIIFVPVRYSSAPSDALLELSIYDKTRKTPNIVIIGESLLPNLIIFGDEDTIKSLHTPTNTGKIVSGTVCSAVLFMVFMLGFQFLSI